MNGKKPRHVCICQLLPKTDLHIINAKNTYKIIIKTVSCCYSLRMLIQQYAEDLNYNLMWRNSNNTSGCPDNLKSHQIARETPASDIIF